ncbi:MAG: ABC transporter permease [Bacteroidales bacterium]|nr:ABC transporter permease [Bacteroidales bacterium]
MRTILILIKKEFLQIFRNPVLWKLVIFLPIAQLLIFPFAADMEIKRLNVAVIDYDCSSFSRDLQNTLNATKYFRTIKGIHSYAEGELAMKRNKVDIIVEIPPDFHVNIYRRQQPVLGITANAVNSMKAAIGVAYLKQFLTGYFERTLQNAATMQANDYFQTNISVSRWFNHKMDYKNIFVPGILAVLVSMIGAMLSTLNIVREKELGTIEQINLTPITKMQFFVGKVFPFWAIGMLEFLAGLGIMFFVFGIHIQGSLSALLLMTAIFLLAMLGMGFMVSIFAENQVQSMFVMIFFFIVFILLSGLFTPIESMPKWAQIMNLVNPIAHFMEILRSIVLKGSSLVDMRFYLLGMSLFAVFSNAITIVCYKNRAD